LFGYVVFFNSVGVVLGEFKSSRSPVIFFRCCGEWGEINRNFRIRAINLQKWYYVLLGWCSWGEGLLTNKLTTRTERTDKHVRNESIKSLSD